MCGFEMHRSNNWQYSSQNNHGFEHKRTVELGEERACEQNLESALWSRDTFKIAAEL